MTTGASDIAEQRMADEPGRACETPCTVLGHRCRGVRLRPVRLRFLLLTLAAGRLRLAAGSIGGVGIASSENALDERFDGLQQRALPGGLTLIVASGRRSRMLGLARLDALPAGHGLLLGRCRSVHTVTMRFALDLVWLDGDGRPVRLDEDVAPRRMRTCLRARSVIETAAGGGARFRAAVGDG